MLNDKNPFKLLTGSDRIGTIPILAAIFLTIIVCALVLAFNGLTGGFVLMALFIFLGFGYFLFTNPIIGLYTAVGLSFILIGLARYAQGVQVGLAMDGILFLTYIALFFNKFREKINWNPARKDITYLAFAWFGYTLLEILNPEARSKEAWFVGFRGIGLYMFLLIPLVLLLIDTRRKIDIFLYIWASFSILASLKGILQNVIGPDSYEKAWLDSGGAVTHVIFGKLRIFSFMSDAGQFGANQALSGLVFTILGMIVKNRWMKIFFFITALLGFYGMFISGTRGAISVPLAGFFLYAFMRKNRFITIAGILAIIAIFIFFKYTTIGQSNYEIRRMRTAFNPDDPSLRVRLDNQKKLREYLASRPFGGGIGHAGVKAQRFLPNAFLSSVATDSWYVLIWAETGIIGLFLYLFILFYILAKSVWLILFRLTDPQVKLTMMALTSGMLGVMVASYGNAVLGTMPTGILIYTSMAILMNAQHFDKEALTAHAHVPASSGSST